MNGLPHDQQADPTAGEQRRWIEVMVAMALLWVPAMFSAVASRVWLSGAQPLPFAYDMLLQVVLAIQVAAPVLYMMWRSGDRWDMFGIVRVRPLLDLAATAALVIVVVILSRVYWAIFASTYYDMVGVTGEPAAGDHFAGPQRARDYVLLVLGCLAIGVQEELVLRGFLLPLLERLLKSSFKAVLVTSLVFASYHAYQQTLEMVMVLIVGLVLGAAFCLVRRIWPLILAHAAMDVLALAGVA